MSRAPLDLLRPLAALLLLTACDDMGSQPRYCRHRPKARSPGTLPHASRRSQHGRR
jgi:hypothetical protein